MQDVEKASSFIQEQEAQPERQPEEPQAQPVDLHQSQPESDKPDESNQDVEDDKMSDDSQNNDSDIKLKETMAHIKKKKGKGGRR